MDATNFPESTGSSSKFSGTSNTNANNAGATTGMGMDPVADTGDTSMASMAGSSDGGSSTGQDTIGSAASSAGGSAPQSAARWTSMAHETVDKVADFASRYTGSPNKALDASKTLMQDKPVVAIGAAVALGVLLGRLISH